MTKPLSETHLTLYLLASAYIDEVAVMNLVGIERCRMIIQETTVDIAEHERVARVSFNASQQNNDLRCEIQRLKRQLSDVTGHHSEFLEQIERLKKELEEYRKIEQAFMPSNKEIDNDLREVKEANNAIYNEGVIEGERRAMERVKEALIDTHKRSLTEGAEWAIKTVAERLKLKINLDEEGVE